MDELKFLREQIDGIDREMIAAFKKRLQIAEQIAEYKLEKGMPVLDRDREKDVLAARRKMADDPSLDHDIDRLYELLMSISRAHQSRIVHREEKKTTRNVFQDGATVGYSGVAGAYADSAQNSYFGGKAASFAYPGFEEVFRAVADGEVEYGVLPIENSYAGSVLQVYDLLNRYDVKIVGEVFLPVDHSLLGIKGASVKQIKEVYSHDQPFLQCTDYLKKYPLWRHIPYYNTAVSAKYVAECADPSKAAIASKYAAEIYGLEVLVPSISASAENTTRFIVVSRLDNMEQEADKASISFVLEHKPGSLARILDSFSELGLNMVKIESRPLLERNFEYRFFVDFLGENIPREMEEALKKIKPYCVELSLLGIYKNGEA
ncbi:MAG: prephenate dehydratase domain-containing protein [Christensenella sp.]|nr:prephenate dehydratase domain-containing protein [Christensenella sp.]